MLRNSNKVIRKIKLCLKINIYPMNEEQIHRHNLTKEIFEHILRVTEHEDQKAGRIILSIAFLATAAASIFNIFVKCESFWYVYNINVIYMLFFIIVVFLVSGAMVMLYALGPSEEDFQIKNLVEGEYIPPSLYYYKMIADTDKEKWIEYIINTDIDKVYSKAYSDHLNESYIIAKRIKNKINRIRISRNMFIISIALIILLTILGIISLN